MKIISEATMKVVLREKFILLSAWLKISEHCCTCDLSVYMKVQEQKEQTHGSKKKEIIKHRSDINKREIKRKV